MNKQQKKIAKKLPTKRNNKHGLEDELADAEMDYKDAERKKQEAIKFRDELIEIKNDEVSLARWQKAIRKDRGLCKGIDDEINAYDSEIQSFESEKEKHMKRIEELRKKLADKQAEEVDEPAQPHISRSWDEFLKDYEKELPASFPTGSGGEGYEEWLTILRYYQSGATDKKRLNNYTKKTDAKAPTTLNKIVEKLIERNKANKKDPTKEKKVKKVKVSKKKAEELTVKDLETPETKPVIDPDEHIKFSEDLQASQLPQELKNSLWDKVSIMQRLVDQGKRDVQQYVDICEEIRFILKLKPEEQKYTETVDRLNELLDKWLALPNDKQNEYKKIQEEMAKEREKLKMHHTQTMPVKDVDEEKKKLIYMINSDINLLKNTKLDPKRDRDVAYKNRIKFLINSYEKLLKENGDDPNNIDADQLEKIFGNFDAALEEINAAQEEKKLLNTFKIHLRSLQAKIDKGIGVTEKERIQLFKEWEKVNRYDDDFIKQANNDRKYVWMFEPVTKEPPAVNRSSSVLKTLDKVPEKIKVTTKRRSNSSSKKSPEITEAMSDKLAKMFKTGKYFKSKEAPIMALEDNDQVQIFTAANNYLENLKRVFQDISSDPEFNKRSDDEKDKTIREIMY